MVETTSQAQAETQRREFVLGNLETIREELKKSGRFYCELTESKLEEIIPRVASEMFGEGAVPSFTQVSIHGKAADVQINTRLGLINVEANIVLENSQDHEHEGEIVTTTIKTKPQRWTIFNIQKGAEKKGKEINSDFVNYVKGTLEKQGIRATGAKFWFTENDTLTIEVEDEERLRELEAQVVSPENMEIISPPPPSLAEPEPVKEPEIIDGVAKEPAPPAEVQEQTPLERLKEDVSLNREKLEASFEDFIGRGQTGEQLEETLDRYTTSLFALNRFLNSQIDPQSVSPGFSKASDKYWSSDDILKSLEQKLTNKDSSLRKRYDLALLYSKKLLGKGGRRGGGRLYFFNELQKGTLPVAVGEIEKGEPEEGAEVEHPVPSWVKPGAAHCEFVRTVNPKTGKSGYLLYFWLGGQLNLQSVDEAGREFGNEFVVKSKVDPLEEVNSLIQEDVKKYETKGLQITRNVPLEIFEETRQKELEELEGQLSKKRGNFYRAVDNYEDARLNLEEAKKAYERSLPQPQYPQIPKQFPTTTFGSTVSSRLKRYGDLLEKNAEPELEKARSPFEETLLAFNNYLNKNIKVEVPGDNKDLLERYQELGNELEELYQGKLKIAAPEQRIGLLREYHKIFEDRLGVYMQIAEQRGLNLAPAVKQEGNFVNPKDKHSGIQVQGIIPTITMKGEDGVLVRVSFLNPEGVPSKPNFSELRSQEGAGVESRPSRVLEKWKTLKDKRILVTPWIWRSEGDDKLLTADISKGGKLDVTDFNFLALHLENYGRDTKSLPGWLINNREDIRDKLIRNAKLASELKFLVPLSSYRLLPDRKDGPPTVFLNELSQVVEGKGSKEEIFRQNLDLIFDTLVRRLQLFTEEEWKSWWYEKVYLPKLKKAA